jgi:hypothetical protein
MLPNPAHLEAVNPVVLGKVRARQLTCTLYLLKEDNLNHCPLFRGSHCIPACTVIIITVQFGIPWRGTRYLQDYRLIRE